MTQFWRYDAGEAFTRLREMPNGSVHCIVTSPPYFRQRDNGIAEQVGMEDYPAAFVDRVCGILDEAMRVLHPQGTLWLNIGDTYADRANGRRATSSKRSRGRSQHHTQPAKTNTIGGAWDLKYRDLMLVPFHLAIELRRRGWYVRRDIIWENPSVQAEGNVNNRPHRSHEYLFLLTRQPTGYFFDRVIGRENHLDDGDPELGYGHAPRSVWSIPGQPFRGNAAGNHSSPMPYELARRAIAMGCPAHVCASCGAPHHRRVETSRQRADGTAVTGAWSGDGGLRQAGATGSAHDERTIIRTVGWSPDCDCADASTSPGVVLDPFAGAATSALAALEQDRSFVGFDLDPEAVDVGRQRIFERLGPIARILDRSLVADSGDMQRVA